jgi:hypothetical protein
MKLSRSLESHAFPKNCNWTMKLLSRKNLIDKLRKLADKLRQIVKLMRTSTILRFNNHLKRQRHHYSNKVSTFEEQEVSNDCRLQANTVPPTHVHPVDANPVEVTDLVANVFC